MTLSAKAATDQEMRLVSLTLPLRGAGADPREAEAEIEIPPAPTPSKSSSSIPKEAAETVESEKGKGNEKETITTQQSLSPAGQFVASPVRKASELKEAAPRPILRQPDLVLNDRIASLGPRRFGEGLKEFHLFPQLPCELRLKIWHHALERRRRIPLRTFWGSYDNHRLTPGSDSATFKATNTLGRVVSGLLYMLHAGGRHGYESRRVPSPLMAVSVEAREATKAFYYLQIPAVSSEKHEAGKPTIYLNPEWDHIQHFMYWRVDFVHLLWDMRAYDPKGVGVRHWVLDAVDLWNITKDDFWQLQGVKTQGTDAMASLLTGLETISFLHHDADSSRLNLPQHHWQYDARFQRRRSPLVPITGLGSEFTLLEVDPRAGVSDLLRDIWIIDNPVEAVEQYKRLLQYANETSSIELPSTPPQGINFWHMIHMLPEWKRPHDDSVARSFVDRADLQELLLADARELDEAEEAGDSTISVDTDPEGNELTERVCGFWLIPSEAFDDLLETANDFSRWCISPEHKAQLGVYRLPAQAEVQ